MEQLSRSIWHVIGLVCEKQGQPGGNVQIFGGMPPVPLIETPRSETYDSGVGAFVARGGVVKCSLARVDCVPGRVRHRRPVEVDCTLGVSRDDKLA